MPPSLILPRDVAESYIREKQQKAYEAEMAKALETAVKTREHYNEDGSVTIERIQDVEGVLELNKARQAQGWDGYNQERDFQTECEIPIVIAEKFKNERGLDILNEEHSAEIHRIIMTDPDYKHLRAHGSGNAQVRVLGAR